MNFPSRVSGPNSRALLPLLATLAFTACKGKSDEATVAPPRDMGPTTLYARGATTHLRKAPTGDAESLEELRIGTECVPLEPVHPGWRKVRCGDKEGYVASVLLDTQKPTVEKLRAQARDPRFTLAQREEAALGAATLAPGDASLSKELGDLFFEHNFELLAGLKKPLKGPELSSPCSDIKELTGCIASSAGIVRNAKRRAETKGEWFVAAIGDAEQVAVYRGRFRFDKADKKLTMVVLERTGFSSTPVMEQALFPGTEKADEEVDASSPRLGQLVLDESAQGLLARLPREWALLERSEEGAPAVRRNGCNQRPYLLWLSPDLLGRWLAVVDKPGAPFPDERWVSAASKTERGTRLTLSRSADDTASQVFEIPETGDAPASLGEALYSDQRQSHGYPDHLEPCGSGGAGAGPAFSGKFEFQEGKAMVALYGRYNAANSSSRWVPSGAERWQLQRLKDVSGLHFLARPWRWGTYREGGQEKILFLTETRTPSVLIVGSGIFSKTEDGWRLERAHRVITGLGPSAKAPWDRIAVHGLGERGFVAVLTVHDDVPGHGYTELVLLSDLGKQESIDRVGTIPDYEEDCFGTCAWGTECEEGRRRAEAGGCYVYESEWTFVPDPEHSLPELVVTSGGTRLKEGTTKKRESFHDLRTFSFRSAEYTLTSRQDVPREEEGTAMTGDTGSKDATEQSLECTLSVPPRHDTRGWGVTPLFKLGNRSARPLFVILWGTPLSTLGPTSLEVTRDGVPVPYQGRMQRHGAPEANDYSTFEPGHSFETHVNLSDFYDMKQPGTYRITPRLRLRDVATEQEELPRSPDQFQAQTLQCPTVETTLVAP